MRTHTIIRPLAAALLAAGVLALGACGSDDDPGGGANAGESSERRKAALAFAQCMRENGVDMPDPSADGRPQRFEVGPGQETTPGEFEKAQKACQKYMDKLKPPELSEEEEQELKDAALAHARCMRENGVENFPDPTFSGKGEVQLRIDKSSGIDPNDADFKEAEKACQDKLPLGPREEQGQ